MFILIWLIFCINAIIVNCEVDCASFNYGSSNYKATFVPETTYANLKTWIDIKEKCDGGYQLVSINSGEENSALFVILRDNCPNGAYAIGLSRESGSDRTMASSWNWESGETVEYLYWASGEPNVEECSFGYMTTSDNGWWRDWKCSDKFGSWRGSNGYGYVCEKSIILSLTADTTVHTGATTNQLNQLTSIGIRTALSDTITIHPEQESEFISLTADTTVHTGATTNHMNQLTSIGIRTALSDTITINPEQESEFKLIWIVVSVVSTLFVIGVFIIIYSCYNRLCCTKRTQKHPEHKIDEVVMTSTSPIESSFNESSDRKKEHKYETKIEKKNNQSSTLRVLDTESEDKPNYAIYNQEDDMGLLYTEIPHGTECEGEVDNPVYTTVTIKAGAVDQPSNAHVRSDELGKPVSRVSKTKTDDNASQCIETCTGTSNHDDSPNMCDNEVKHLEDLYARPDMSKKAKSKMKHSNNKIPSNIRKNDTVSSATDVITPNTTAEVKNGQDMINNNHNTGDVNRFRRNLDYEVVDLEGV
ncbi:uncharacterized protein [Antedon mediterranea]|uniref:uncharacterized protein n=1 Tax=Antedon mediterranea TaxID=105859 RepID=UPI003AF9C085